MIYPAKYRTKEELEEYKDKDPINQVLNVIRENGYATEEQVEQINEKVRLEVEECVRFAEESPWPDDSELYKDIYATADYPYITD